MGSLGGKNATEIGSAVTAGLSTEGSTEGKSVTPSIGTEIKSTSTGSGGIQQRSQICAILSPKERRRREEPR